MGGTPLKELYVVLFEGKVRERESKRDVRQRLMEQFHIDRTGADRLFSGQRIVVFRSEDRAKTDDFAHRFANTGALCRIEVEFQEDPDAPRCTACGHAKTSPEASCAWCQREEAAREHETVDARWKDDDPMPQEALPPLLPLWQAYAGPRGEWYAARFRLFAGKERPTFVPTWNWGAFLFGIVWLIYRKMYALAFLFFGISAAGIVFPGGSVAVSIFFGLFANFLYYLHVKKKIDTIIANSDHIDPDQAIESMGGVNPIPKVLALFLIMMAIMAVLGSYLLDIKDIAPLIK